VFTDRKNLLLQCHLLVMTLINICSIMWKLHILEWYRGYIFLLRNLFNKQ